MAQPPAQKIGNPEYSPPGLRPVQAGSAHGLGYGQPWCGVPAENPDDGSQLDRQMLENKLIDAGWARSAHVGQQDDGAQASQVSVAQVSHIHLQQVPPGGDG